MNTKVIHVHFLVSHKNYYFGSIAAIYDVLTVSQVGISEAALRHLLTEEGCTYLNKSVFITRSSLIRKSR